MRRLWWLVVFIAVVSPPVIDLHSQDIDTSRGGLREPGRAQGELGAPAFDDADFGDADAAEDPFAVQRLEQQLEGPFDAESVVATSEFIGSTGVVEWLGPLAPLALSPFFGVTCLSGLALWGPEWATDNTLLASSGPLRSEVMFVIFLVLTILTSVPRMTKVSKPFAQAVDRLETYSVIVILLIIKIAASTESPGEEPIAMVQLGIVSFTVDALLAIAMVINILIVNSVKFFFEFLVWLTPVPFLDAIFEICNKSLCAVLMAVYALSPTLATVINLVILLAAALVLRWISRRVRFYRTMILDPVLAQLWSGFGKPRRPELIVFPRSEIGPFKAKSRLRLARAPGEGGGWILREANWWMPSKQHELPVDPRPSVRCGWVMHSIEIAPTEGDAVVFCFSRRYDRKTLDELVSQLGMEMSNDETTDSSSDVAHQFA